MSFSSEPRHPSRQYPRWPLAPCSSFLSTAPHGRLDACGRRRRAGRGASPHARRQQHPLRLPERRSVGRRRPAPPKPPEATAWPSTHLCTLQGRRRELEGAERAPCRRRARTAVPSRTGALPKSDRGFSGETVPVDHHDDAKPPKPPAQPLPRHNCSPALSRSRPPPRIAYKRRSQARTRTRTITPPHKNHARPLGRPRGGLLPQLRPPRPALGSSTIHSRAGTPASQLMPVVS